MTAVSASLKCHECKKLASAKNQCTKANCMKPFCYTHRLALGECAACGQKFCLRHMFQCEECLCHFCDSCDSNNHSDDRQDICFECYIEDGELYLDNTNTCSDEAMKAIRFYFETLNVFVDASIAPDDRAKRMYQLAVDQWQQKLPPNRRRKLNDPNLRVMHSADTSEEESAHAGAKRVRTEE